MKIWTNFISISLNMQRSGLNVIVASNMLTQIQICTWKGIHIIYMNRVLDLKWLYSFHNKLKTPYLHGKVNRRVDFLLNVLLRIEEDNFFNYMKKYIFQLLREMNAIVTRMGCLSLQKKYRYHCHYGFLL